MLEAVFRRNAELWYALVAIAATTALYLILYSRLGSLPPARGLAGHGIGVLGFVLMLVTETAYSLRKRATRARWGKMSGWLRFHMVTGMVGSYMVLLHPAMRFHGLAAILSLLTVVVVASGFVGRYIYTAVPRTIDGVEIETTALEGQIALAQTVSEHTVPPARPTESTIARLTAARRALATWRAIHVPLTLALFLVAFVHIGGAIYYATLLR